ncbi:MAG: hypothetical protein L0Z62_37565 [Gemmataceae bacterium]|nr:hypothetical protein [Gemmataceae bacterium]
MRPEIQADNTPIYQTITGGRISLSNLTDAEHNFLTKIAKKYSSRQDWTRFAAWWNAEFNAAGLTTSSVVYRICQDLEARLGIDQGKVSPPDYRDFLVELIDTQFGSRQAFCRATEVDPGQLSRVLASRGDLSMKVLQKVFEVLHGHLVIQTEEESRARTSIDRAATAIANAVALRTHPSALQVVVWDNGFKATTRTATEDPLVDQVEYKVCA